MNGIITRCIDLALQLHFPQLKLLYLYGVSISTSGIHSLLAGCTALEGLQIEGTCGLTDLLIVSYTLCTIGVSCRSVIGDGEVTSILLVILFASSLERLILLDAAKPTSILVHRAPKSRVLGYATTRSSFLRIGGITIKVQQSSS